MTRTSRQEIAITHTCRLPEETQHPRFLRVHTWGASSILTFNSGFE